MPDRIVQPNPGNIASITDDIVRAEIRKLWELAAMRGGQIGNESDAFVTRAELEALRRQLRLTRNPSTGYRATTIGDSSDVGSSTGGGGNPIYVKDESILLTPSTGGFNFVGSGVTATQSGSETLVTIDGAGGGQSRSQVFTASGTFTVPAGVTLVYLTMIAAGGGGSSTSTTSGRGGGGSGEYCINFPYPVEEGQSYAVTVGAGGAGALGGSSNVAGGNGGLSGFDAVFVQGGLGGVAAAVTGGAGGGFRGGAGGGSGVVGGLGSLVTPVHFGGSGGSGGGNSSVINGAAGVGAGGFIAGASGGTAGGGGGGGGGGASTIFGIGGAGGNGTAPGSSAPSTSYGAGGGGAGGVPSSPGKNGGSGAGGYVLVGWVGVDEGPAP